MNISSLDTNINGQTSFELSFNNPTEYPTISPTIAPTVAPTECVYYNEFDYDNSGKQDANISDLNIVMDTINYIDSTKTNELVIKYSISNSTKYRNFYIECDRDRAATSCIIGCYGEENCVNTTVLPDEKYINMNKIFVICDAKSSCKAMDINIVENSNIHTLYVLCISIFSCKSMDINIKSKITMEITIQCIRSLSCEGMNINIDIMDTNWINIECYSTASCNNLFINNIRDSNMTITMNEYSENIQIIDENYEKIQFICNELNEAHFIKYNTNEILSESQIMELVKKTYESGQLPCSGIFIDCSIKNDYEKKRECGIKYTLSLQGIINETEIITKSHIFNCFWVNIEDILESFTIITKTDSFDVTQSFIEKYKLEFGIIAAIIFLLLIVLIIFLCKKRDKQMREYISNALVVVIGIGYYERDEVKGFEIDGYVKDLPVEYDIKHMRELFGDILKYKIMPYDKYKIEWNQDELVDFLKNDVGKELFMDEECQQLKYDGLIVCISCHGIKDNILTSDYQIIEKKYIHRILSKYYPMIREIPRIFIFDSCEGDAEREYLRQETVEQGKAAKLEDITDGLEWTQYTKNPDYKLVEIHAANTGFQAKCSGEIGSYLIYYFTQKMKKNIAKKENKTLSNIFEEIQEELHEKGKQQTTNTFNNKMGYLQFNKNNVRTDIVETNVEMTEIDHDVKLQKSKSSDGYMSIDTDDNQVLNNVMQQILDQKSE